MPKVLLIIPAFNESESILEVIAAIKAYQRRQATTIELDYLVINDGSTDNEEEILRANGINHIELIQNLGIGAAVQTGYLYARKRGYDIAVQFDGDGQHDINSLDDLLAPLISNEADFVVGSRYISDSQSKFKSSVSRRVGSRILSFTVRLVTGIDVKDITSGYRACNRKVIQQFAERYPSKFPEPESYVHLAKKNIRVKEVGANMFERTTGKSSINYWVAVKYMVTVSTSILLAGTIEKEK